MMLSDRIRAQFTEHIELVRRCPDELVAPLTAAVERVTAALIAGNKVLVCGNGGSAADAQHLAAELVGRYERERPGLAAIALTVDTSILTAVANDYEFAQVFARQVRALGRTGDVLVAISTSGNSANIVAAVEAAHEVGLAVIVLSGGSGGRLRALSGASDIHLCVPHERTARIQEIHLLILHCLCDGIDSMLPGGFRSAVAEK